MCDELRSGENPGVFEPKVRDIPVALALVSNLKVILKFIRLCRKVEDDIGITLDRKTVPRGGVRKCQIVKYDLGVVSQKDRIHLTFTHCCRYRNV